MTAFQQLPSATGDNEPLTARTDPSPRRASIRTPSVEKTPRATGEEEAPVMARTNGLFGSSKMDSTQNRRRAAGTVTGSASYGRSDKGTEFKSARSSGGGGWPKWATGRKSNGDSTPRPIVSTNSEMHKTLVSQLETVKAENEALKKENKKMSEELIIRARSIAQHRDQNSKLMQEISVCGRHPLQRVRQISPREASAGPPTPHAKSSIPEDHICPCVQEGSETALTLESHGRRDSGDYRIVTRRGSISRPPMDEELETLRTEIDSLLNQQSQLKDRNAELRRLIEEAETERSELEREVMRLREAAETARTEYSQHETSMEQKRLLILEEFERERMERAQEMNELERQKEDLERKVRELDRQARDMEALVAAGTGDRLRLQQENEEIKTTLEKAIEQSRNELEQVETALKKARDGLRELEDNINRSRSELDNVQMTKQVAQQETNELKQQRSSLEAQLSDRTEELEAIESNVRELSVEEAALRTSVMELQGASDRLAAARRELQRVLAEKERALRVIREADVREKAVRNIDEERRLLECDLSRLKASIEDAGRQLSAILEEKTRGEAKVAQLQDRSTTLESRASELRVEVEELQSRAEKLKVETAAGGAELARIRAATIEAKTRAEVAIAEAEAAEARANTAESALETPRPETLVPEPRNEEWRRPMLESNVNMEEDVIQMRCEDLRQAQERETAHLAGLRSAVTALEERKRMREGEFARLSEKCEELTRRLEELRGQESAFARSRASSRGILSKEELSPYGVDRVAFAVKVDDPFGVNSHTEVLALEAELHTLSTRKRELETAIVTAGREWEEQVRAAELAAANKAALEQSINKLGQDKEELADALRALQRECADANTALATVKAEAAETATQLANLKAEADAVTARLKGLREEHAAVIEQTELAKRASASAKADQLACEAGLSALTRETELRHNALKEVIEEQRNAENVLANLQERAAATAARVADLEAAAERERAAAAAAEKVRRETETRVTELHVESTRLAEELERRRDEERVRCSRAEDDRARSRAQYESALREAQAELRLAQSSAAQTRERLEAELRELRSARLAALAEEEARLEEVLREKEAEARAAEARAAEAKTEAETAWKQLRRKGGAGIARLRAAAEQAVADVLLKDIEGLEQKTREESPSNSFERHSSRPWASPMSPQRAPFEIQTSPWGSPPPVRRATHDGHLAIASLQTSPLGGAGRRKSDLFPLREEELQIPSTTSASQPHNELFREPQFGRTRSSSTDALKEGSSETLVAHNRQLQVQIRHLEHQLKLQHQLR